MELPFQRATMIGYVLVALGMVIAIAMMPTRGWGYAERVETGAGYIVTIESGLFDAKYTFPDYGDSTTQSFSGDTYQFWFPFSRLSDAGIACLACSIVAVVLGLASAILLAWHAFKPNSRKFLVGAACSVLSALMLCVGSIVYARLTVFSWAFLLFLLAGYVAVTGSLYLSSSILKLSDMAPKPSLSTMSGAFSY